MNFLLWLGLIYGIMTIIVRSQLFDAYRRWYDNQLYPIFTPSDDVSSGEFQYPVKKHKPNLVFKLLNKFISCWLCITFWTATILGIFNIGPLSCPIADGALAVGFVALIERYFERFEY